MRLTPAQIAVHHLCGRKLPLDADETLSQRIRNGRDYLVKVSGQDFGYDLRAWHKHLSRSRDGGYTWNTSIELPKIMAEALADPDWLFAIESLQTSTEQSDGHEAADRPF